MGLGSRIGSGAAIPKICEAGGGGFVIDYLILRISVLEKLHADGYFRINMKSLMQTSLVLLSSLPCNGLWY